MAQHPEQLARTITENLLTYAVGRRAEYSDMPTIRAIVRDASKSNNKLSSYILGVINSPAFRMAKPQQPTSLTTDEKGSR